jgi:DNA-binding NtrC family response regulator
MRVKRAGRFAGALFRNGNRFVCLNFLHLDFSYTIFFFLSPRSTQIPFDPPPGSRLSCVYSKRVDTWVLTLNNSFLLLLVWGMQRDVLSDTEARMKSVDALYRNPDAALHRGPESTEAGVENKQKAQRTCVGELVFCSEIMWSLDYELTRVARFDFDVLLEGETGVGKDLVAREIHRRGSRHGKPFVSVPLRSLSPTLIESELFGHERGAFSGAEKTKAGIFESAQGGVLYIPEISCLDEDLQLKLLSFMQYKRFHRVGEDPRRPERLCDVRLIFATNENLLALVHAGRLREDFFYRIKGLSLRIPPLRERGDDVIVLAEHFLKLYDYGQQLRLGDAAIEQLRAHTWPGNVRELENAIKAAVPHAKDGVISHLHLDTCACLQREHKLLQGVLQDPASIPSYAEMEQRLRTEYFRGVLHLCANHIPTAARKAGMTEQGFRKALRRLESDTGG